MTESIEKIEITDQDEKDAPKTLVYSQWGAATAYEGYLDYSITARGDLELFEQPSGTMRGLWSPGTWTRVEWRGARPLPENTPEEPRGPIFRDVEIPRP